MADWFGIVVMAALTSLVVPGTLAVDNSSYWATREQFLEQELETMIGMTLVLSVEEELVNQLLMKTKILEMDEAYKNLNFLPAKNFLLAKDEIENSDVFKIIRSMPKGGALHLHESAMGSSEFVVNNISYWADLYMCSSTDNLLMRFFDVPDDSCGWELVSEVRANYPTDEDFDVYLLSRLTIYTNDPDTAYPDINAVWADLQQAFTTQEGIVMHRPAWESYLYNALLEFAQDNVAYLEFRGTLPPLYEKNGTLLGDLETMDVYRQTVARFKADHGDRFYDARFIYAPPKIVPEQTMYDIVSLAGKLRTTFPEFVVGFDLVGQEDLMTPLKEYLDPLLSMSEQGVTIPVFYHAGETNWMGMTSDENIVDALLLNSTRLGHGYAIVKHPVAKQMAKDRDVPLEVCPISNQVLKLVSDLRNHPAAGLVAEGFPLVISADDPSMWGAKGLSYDLYEAFMAFGGAKADLKFLKQLSINSIRYSGLEDRQMQELMKFWQTQWDEWITTTNRLHAKNKKFYPGHMMKSF